MKMIVYLCSLAMICLAACSEPMSVTANPSDHTNAGGTAGSAKMTNQLPPKADNMRVKDTLRLPGDSSRNR